MNAFDRYDGAGFPDAMAGLKACLIHLNDWHLDLISHDYESSGLWRARAVWLGGEKREYASGYGATPVVRAGGESWICSRCPESFPTREACDTHQATHPPIPTPSVGQRAAANAAEAAQRLLRGVGE